MNRKKIVFRSLLMACLTLMVGVFFAATAQADHLTNTPKYILKSASELDYPPFALVRPDGSADGFSVDLLKAVVKAVSMEVDLTVGRPWHVFKQELAEGRLDVLPLVFFSSERDKVYDFTVPYFRMHGDIFVRRGEDVIHSIADLRNKKILVMRDDIAHEYLVRKKLTGNLILTDSFAEALKMLSAGQHDAVVAQELVGLRLIKKLGLANIVAIHSSKETRLDHSPNVLLPGFEQKFSFAVREGDADLLAHLNEGLALVIANGTYGRLQEKWFAAIFPAPSIPRELLVRYTIQVLVPVFLILALAGVWFLKREVVHKTQDLQSKIEKQKQAEELWEKTFDAMSDIITIQDKDMKILRANKTARDFFGVKPGGLNGKHCYEIFRGADHPCAQCPEIETIIDRRSHFGTIKHDKLGKTFYVSSYPIFEENGDIKYIVHVAKDITEQKKLEEELFQSHKMEAIGTLAGGIAHDFNNILTGIIGYSELTLINLPENSQNRSHVYQIYKAGNRAKELVKQILSFGRKNKQKLEPCAPSSIIKEALKLMRASLPATIAIKTEIDPDCGKIMADQTNLHQILVNLCTNALHAIKNEKGEILVKLSQQQLNLEEIAGQISVEPGVFIVLSVTDTGCGMDETTIDRIFEPYFTTKDIGKGTGMGLFVVHSIMQNYGGMIKVASEPGKGTVFNLYFPAIEKVTDRKETKKYVLQRSLPQGNERIMVVDDEETIVKAEQMFLENLGYSITSKNSSVEALEEFRRNPDKFDLLITDQTMPVMTGVDLSKKITELKPDVPIILCTGHSSIVTEKVTKGTGVRRFAQKPVGLKELAVMVREVLDNN